MLVLVVTCLILLFPAFSISRWHPHEQIPYTIIVLSSFALLLTIAISTLLPSCGSLAIYLSRPQSQEICGVLLPQQCWADLLIF